MNPWQQILAVCFSTNVLFICLNLSLGWNLLTMFKGKRRKRVSCQSWHTRKRFFVKMIITWREYPVILYVKSEGWKEKGNIYIYMKHHH